MTELLVGTKKGLFVLEGEPGGAVRGAPRARSPASRSSTRCATRAAGRVLAAVTSPFYGPKIFYADDPAASGSRPRASRCPRAASRRSSASGRSCPARRDGTLYAGGDPGVLFESRDGGATLGAQPRRCGSTRRGRRWQPGGGGLCLHSIVPWPGEPDRLALAISAVGVWLTDDGGATLAPAATTGSCAALPARGRARGRRSALCVHSLAPRAGAARAACSCSSTAACTAPTTPGRAWTDIGAGLPSDFGFPLALDPADPDSAYVIPLIADIDRVTPGGPRARLRDARRRRELDAARRRACRPSTPT